MNQFSFPNVFVGMDGRDVVVGDQIILSDEFREVTVEGSRGGLKGGTCVYCSSFRCRDRWEYVSRYGM
jgi:hypothetical protein